MDKKKISLQDSTLKYGVIQVTRDYKGVEFIESSLSKEEEQMIITDIHMNPHKTVLKITSKNGHTVYLQHVGTPEYALIGILLASSNTLTDTLAFHPDAKTLNAYLTAHKKISNVNLTIDHSLSDLAGLKGLNGLLFAVLTGKPIISLSNDEPATKKLFLALLSLLPPELAKIVSLITYSESFSDIFTLIGMPITSETAKIAEQHADTHTIVDIREQVVFSLYECTVTTHLATTIQSNDGAKVFQILSEIFEQAWQVKEMVKTYKEEGNDEEHSIVADISETLNCSMADAELYFLLGSRMVTKPTIKERKMR